MTDRKKGSLNDVRVSIDNVGMALRFVRLCTWAGCGEIIAWIKQDSTNCGVCR